MLQKCYNGNSPEKSEFIESFYIINCFNNKFYLIFIMKKLLLILLLLPSYLFANNLGYRLSILKEQRFLETRNFRTSLWNTGIFNQSIGEVISPSFEWPVNSGKYLGISAGLCIGAYMNGNLRIATASYNGEFVPGYVINGGGVPIPKTTIGFHLYKVSKGDNCQNNPDYCNWGDMVLKGAPYNDVNNNEIYDDGIDVPGMKGASQTIFAFLTDGFQESHNISEGFSGGTAPLYATVQFVSWAYEIENLEDVQFFRYKVTNMSLIEWKKTYFSLFYHPQIGDSLDDYIGCDTLRRLGYAYNRDNEDGTGIGNSYGNAPPAVGIKLLNDNLNIGMTSFHYTIPIQSEPCLPCEELPYNPQEAYNLMRGYKKDNTPWVDATSPTPKPTKYTFPGDPETGQGWTEYNGVVNNCLGSLTGEITPNQSVARTFLMSMGSETLNINSSSYPEFYFAQLTAGGNNNKNSVTKLKELADKVQQFYNNNYTIGINTISSEVPDKFSLYQNYPNPFNPTTNIKFEIPQSDFINLSVYDINGRLIEEVVNENISAGIYEVKFSGKNLSSGIYFYRLKSSKSVLTNKMILIK